MKAFLKNARISPKKANLVAGMIRGMNAEEAISLLDLLPKKGARVLRKILASAVSNAKNNFEQDKEKLMIKEIIVSKGVSLKRSMPIARGRAHPIVKRNSNITIEVGMTAPELKKS